MKSYGCTSVHAFLGDLIVYRRLVPADPRLLPLTELRSQVGLPPGVIPRKSEPEYARVIAHLLRQARALDAPGTPIECLVYVGDTQLSDGTAFTNICRAGGWSGVAFIGTGRGGPGQVEIVEGEAGPLYVASQWTALADLAQFCEEHRFAVDERAAVVVDLDKTALGARGRNDHIIDQARVEAVQVTVGALLGDAFGPKAFRAAYGLLNQPEFHPFTTDNQDYLAYICLILGSDLFKLTSLVANVRAGWLASFEQFIAQVDARADELPTNLRQIHEAVYACVQAGDPTPFKAFRRNEYRATVERMGCLDENASVLELLEKEIVITQEVREIALAWRGQGALLFGLSDKPDEASIPSEELAVQGYKPIHRVETHAVGG